MKIGSTDFKKAYVGSTAFKKGYIGSNQFWSNASDLPFIIKVKTDNSGSTDDDQYVLPLQSGTYNFVVDWGDDSTNTITSYTDTDKTHTYDTAGTYTITMTGVINGFGHAAFETDLDNKKLIDIMQWGNVILHNNANQFRYCTSLTHLSATDQPQLSHLTTNWYMFGMCSNLVDGFSHWDVSEMTSFYGLFGAGDVFNDDISGWDTSNITEMQYMFSGQEEFDYDLSDWDIRKVTDMRNFLNAANMSVTNYSNTLISWAAQGPKSDIVTDFGYSKYNTAGAVARNTLINTYGWTIEDGGPE